MARLCPATVTLPDLVIVAGFAVIENRAVPDPLPEPIDTPMNEGEPDVAVHVQPDCVATETSNVPAPLASGLAGGVNEYVQTGTVPET